MKTGAELLLFADPQVGHLLAEVELGRRLVALHPQISIAILIPKLPVPNDKTDAFIRSFDDAAGHDRISLVELPPPPPQVDSTILPNHVLLVDRLATLYKPIVKRVAEDRRTIGIVFDMFCAPMVEAAEELGIPAYLFYTSGANILSMMFHLEPLAVDLPSTFGELPPESTPVNFSGFKNPLPIRVWPEVFLNKALSLADPFMRFASQYRKARGILVNTFSELESDILKSLSQNELIPPTYSVGPILHIERNRNGNSDGELTESPRDPILSWLDSQPSGSVVFLCFGSQIESFEKVQVEQLAAGIEKSGHRFLWSVRDSSESLPEGFLDRTAGVGKVIGWAPQTEVLGHAAVGAFVSHCGWNSTLESLWFGVPMVAWPMYAEQQLNAFLLVKELGLAVDLKMDYRFDLGVGKGRVVVEAAEVEAAIRRVMEEEEGVVVRRRVKEMSDLARKAMDVGGSSHVSLSCFLEDVMEKCSAN